MLYIFFVDNKDDLNNLNNEILPLGWFSSSLSKSSKDFNAHFKDQNSSDFRYFKFFESKSIYFM